MDVEDLHRPANEVGALADSVHDLLLLAFGPRGALADITYTVISLGEQGMDGHAALYAVRGTLTVHFTLPHVPIPLSDDTDVHDSSSEVPF